jgi:hypothetical protein
MTFLDQLRALRTSPQAVWLRFVGAYQSGRLDLYAFFEGNDDLSYYQPYLRQKWAGRGQLHGFNCNGKDHVVGVMARVKQTLDHEWRALFFIDKDVDDFCGHARHSDPFLFETECYSIENYITHPVTLSVMWTDLLCLPATDARLTEILKAYDAAYHSFVTAMKQVMAWIIHLRRSGCKVVLNDMSMDNVISIDREGKCSLKGGWADHILAASNTHGAVYEPAAFAGVVAELDPCDPRTYIRGKFDL